MNMELVEMGASKQEGEEFAGQPWVCTQQPQPQLQQREMESSNYYTFCSTDGNFFEKRSIGEGKKMLMNSNKYPQP